MMPRGKVQRLCASGVVAIFFLVSPAVATSVPEGEIGGDATPIQPGEGSINKVSNVSDLEEGNGGKHSKKSAGVIGSVSLIS